MLAEYDIEVHYVNFPLHPDTPDAGIALVDLFGGGPAAGDFEIHAVGT